MKLLNNFSKDIFIVFLIFISLTISIHSFFEYYVNDDANTTNNDKWSFTGSVGIVPIDDDEYANGLRGEMSGNIESDLFGDFSFSKLDLKEDSSTNCSTGETYNISGTISSDFYGEMSVVENSSYYCPSVLDFQLVVNSDMLGDKTLTQNLSGTIVPYNIFDKKELSINGIAKISGDKNDITDGGGGEINQIYVDEGEKTIYKTQINKNIGLITKNLEPENNKGLDTIDGVICISGDCIINDFTNNTIVDKNYYFDYTGIDGVDNGYFNEGKNLVISKGNFFSSSSENYRMPVTGKNTVIVKGGNIYINGDISNENDNTDLLVLIAKRDSNNLNNGGNIYIDPNVTNIDAVLIADGSILNFDGTNITSIFDDIDKLRRQIYIYGTLLSSNVIGTNEIPYGADEYINGNNSMPDNIYDLINFRAFQARYASGSGATLCGGNSEFWVGYSGTQTDGIQDYAWAGKSECFNEKINLGSGDTPVSGLRVTDKFNSLVIEYNPNISKIFPLILGNN